MPLALAFAEHADAARIAEIHMAAFNRNAMLIAQFPTPAVRDALKKSIELKARADIDDPKTTVLVVRCSISGGPTDSAELSQSEPDRVCRPREKVIAFAKWSHPVPIDEDYTEPPWIWPEGTDFKVLGDWASKSEEAQSRAVGDVPCYRE